MPVTSYDLSSGACDELCALPLALPNPQVATHDGTLLIYSDGMSPVALTPAVVRVRDGQATELAGTPPTFVADSETIAYILFSEKRNIHLHGVLASTSDGFGVSGGRVSGGRVSGGRPCARGTEGVTRSGTKNTSPVPKW